MLFAAGASVITRWGWNGARRADARRADL